MSNDGFVWAEHAEDLSKSAREDADFYAMLAAELLRPSVALAVDFGCGGGGMAVALREQATRSGIDVAVAGLDAHPEVYATTARQHPDIRFATASFEDSAARIREAAGGAPDLIWARGAVHHADDEQEALGTLTDVLAPGGVLALAEGGTTASFLPAHVGVGQPGLDVRLNAALHTVARRRMHNLNPMPHGWQAGMRAAGLTDTRTRNVLFDRPEPLEGADLDFVLHKAAKQFEWAEEELSDDDRAAWRRLLDADDPAWLGHRGDLFYLAAASVHIGVKPGGP
ncbi:MAG TPA: class I SAM-dependent methyltransferase [Stackebrandtia sp.]|jgi:SAM-dependent methyltransferase|uniref:class I SAM-dependent methyltransferase n=1 Tax=Stackebrandtia sp. TaxID=2023065 RepID=UPI002D593CBD|nr:class I SAM-dependent methyltransferase [Stackebrandtia sp.]HZE39064.1 class I SAM-dependent methyltransferase [Stackebrandtia sp.]